MNARDIVTALGGRWHGSYGMARCVCHNDGGTPGLKIKDDPRKSDGVDVVCFAGCSWQDIKAELRKRGYLSAGMFPQIGIGCISTGKQKAAFRANPNAAYALEMWRSAVPAKGTPVETYLQARGHDTSKIPPTIRYLPDAKHGPTGLLLPCMVGAVSVAPSTKVVAVHRTFLTADGRSKAPVSSEKMMLGPCAGGAVRLAPTPVDGELAISEGIETGLAAQQATGIATWAALSTSGMQTIILPEVVRSVVILADADEPGQRAAEALAARLSREGRAVRIARPPIGKDFADSLVAGAA